LFRRYKVLSAKSFNYLALYDTDYKKIMGNLAAVSEAAKEVIGFVFDYFSFQFPRSHQQLPIVN